jgi:hypothetical protein
MKVVLQIIGLIALTANVTAKEATEIVTSISPISESGDNVYVKTRSGRKLLLYTGADVPGDKYLKASLNKKSNVCIKFHPPKRTSTDAV